MRCHLCDRWLCTRTWPLCVLIQLGVFLLDLFSCQREDVWSILLKQLPADFGICQMISFLVNLLVISVPICGKTFHVQMLVRYFKYPYTFNLGITFHQIMDFINEFCYLPFIKYFFLNTWNHLHTFCGNYLTCLIQMTANHRVIIQNGREMVWFLKITQ